MLSSTTAQRLLPYASSEVSTLLFKACEEFLNPITNQPDSNVILSKWSSLSSESACTVAGSITDPDLLDKILLKERRKTVLRVIASNLALSLVSRTYLYQISLITNDSDLKAYVLNNMPNEIFVEMATNDNLLRSSTNTNMVLQKISDANNIELTIKFLATQEPDYIVNLIPYNIGLVLAVGKKMNFDFSGKEIRTSRYGGRANVKTPNIEEIKDLYTLLNNSRYNDFFIDLLESNLEKLALVSSKLVAASIKRLHVYSIADVKVCIELNLLEHLAENSQPEDSSAAELLLSNIPLELAGKTILEHPDPEKAILWALKDFPAFLEMGKANNRSLTSFINRNFKKLGLVKFWQLVRILDDKEISTNFYELAIKEGFTSAEFISSIPTDLLPTFKSLPSEFDFLTFLERVENEIDLGGRKKPIEVVLSSIGRSYARDEEKEETVDVKAVKMLFADGHKNSLLEILNKGRISEKANKLIGDYIRNDSEMLSLAGSVLSNHRNNNIIVNLIDLISPANGWVSLTRNPDVAQAAYNYLESNLSGNLQSWETTLTLFDDWTGTLPALVLAAKNI